MGRFYLKSGLFVLAAAFCILLGVNLAGNGVEQINGPFGGGPADNGGTVVHEQPPEVSEQSKLEAQRAKEKEAERVRAAYERLKRSGGEEGSLFGSIGSAIGSVLSHIASFVVTLFSSLFDILI